MICTPEEKKRSCKDCRLTDICRVYQFSGQLAQALSHIREDVDVNELAWQILAANCFYFEHEAK